LACVRDGVAGTTAISYAPNGDVTIRCALPGGPPPPPPPPAGPSLRLPFGASAAAQLVAQARIDKADLVFNVDTTGSMGGEISNLQTGLTTTIVPGVRALLADTQFGVTSFEDFPYNTCNVPGSPACAAGLGNFGAEFGDVSGCGNAAGDRPFTLVTSVGGDVAIGLASLDSPLGCGVDVPESGWEALRQLATGAGWASFSDSTGDVYSPLVPAFTPSSTGSIGGVGFRANALPIVLHVTDAPSHSDADYAPFFSGAASRSTAIAALDAIAARVITANSGGVDVQAELTSLASDTGASVPACAWSFDLGGTPASRPPGCAVTQCCTGLNGAGVPPTGDSCPLALRFSTQGTGLPLATVSAVGRLLAFAKLNVRLVAREDPSRPGGLCLLRNLTPIAATNPFPGCATAATPIDPDPAMPGNEGFDAVTPGSTLDFEIRGQNDCIPQSAQEQTFGVFIDVVSDGVLLLGSSSVSLVVPAQ